MHLKFRFSVIMDLIYTDMGQGANYNEQDGFASISLIALCLQVNQTSVYVLS